MDCSRITDNFVGGACGAVLAGGTGTKTWIFNYDEIDRSTSTLDADGNISTMAMLTGKKGVTFQTVENGNEAGSTFNKGTYLDSYDHTVTLRFFKDSKDAKAWINKATGARIVVFQERKTQSDNVIEVFGWDSGLKMSENQYNTNFTDGVSYAPVFATDDKSKESCMPRTYLGTESALNALCQSSSQE